MGPGWRLRGERCQLGLGLGEAEEGLSWGPGGWCTGNNREVARTGQETRGRAVSGGQPGPVHLLAWRGPGHADRDCLSGCCSGHGGGGCLRW